MKRMKAYKTFWSDGRLHPRRLVERGETFETDDQHAQELYLNKIAAPEEEPTAGPSQTQAMQPDEQPAPSFEIPEDLDNLPYNQIKDIAKQLNIARYNQTKKAELIQKIKDLAKGD